MRFWTHEIPFSSHIHGLQPLINALLEYDLDEETYLRYDAMSARELFR